MDSWRAMKDISIAFYYFMEFTVDVLLRELQHDIVRRNLVPLGQYKICDRLNLVPLAQYKISDRLNLVPLVPSNSRMLSITYW